jgi:hypothetical protein
MEIIVLQPSQSYLLQQRITHIVKGASCKLRRDAGIAYDGRRFMQWWYEPHGVNAYAYHVAYVYPRCNTQKMYYRTKVHTLILYE